jgi:hypothetical protein
MTARSHDCIGCGGEVSAPARRAGLGVAILLCLPAALASSLRAQDGIRVGPELALPGAPNPADGGRAATPSAAFGRGVYLVAWCEGWQGKGGSARIVAARVAADGKLLDARAFPLATVDRGVQELPRVAFAGGVFLVVWQQFNGHDCDVLAVRVDPGGKVLDARPIEVAARPRTQALPDVAADGSAFLVVWQGLVGQETAYRGFAATVGADGKLGTPMETGATPQPQAAWNGTSYMVVSGGTGVFAGSIRGVILGRDGRPAGAKPAPVRVMYGTKAARFCIAGIPGAEAGWLVVSHRAPPDPWGWGGPGAARVAFVNAVGRVQNPDALKEPAGVKGRLPGWLDVGREKSKTATWPFGSSTAVWEGRQCVVVWQRHHLTGEKMTNFTNCDLIAARVRGFESQDPAGIPLADSVAEETCPALASDGAGGLLCAYQKTVPEAKAAVCARMLRTR